MSVFLSRVTRVWQSEKEKELQSTKQDTLQRYHDNLKREFEQQRLDYQNQPSAEHKLALENTQSLLVNIERQINALKRLSGDERACSPPLSLISRVSCPSRTLTMQLHSPSCVQHIR